MHHEGMVTNVDISTREDVDKLRHSAVGLTSVLFFCVTGSAPLAVTLFNTPYVGPLGSSWGGPGAFSFATIVLTIFSVAYVQLCLKVRAAGGMYTFVSYGLGRPLGMMAGFSLMIAYTIFGASLIGGFAAFTQNTLAVHLSFTRLSWIWYALFAVAVVCLLGYFDVQISAKILGVALIGELIVILIFTFGILFQGGADGVSIDPILPWNGIRVGLAPGLGVFFAFWSWVGFEAAPNYAEESKDPVRTIPIAVYFSCVGVGVLYTLMMWALVTAYGHGNAMAVAFAKGTATPPKTTTLNGYTFASDYTTIVTGPMHAYVGKFFASAMDWLIVTGSLACASALSNAGLRYWYAMGREGILPRALGATHKKHKTPHIAILTIGVINVALILIFWFLNRLPLDMYGWLAVQGVIWIVLVQALTALSAFFYFRRHHEDEVHVWKTVIAPWLGFLGQVYVLLLLYANLTTNLAASNVLYVKQLFTIPFPNILKLGDLEFSWIGVIGVLVPLGALLYAYYLKSSNPQKYEVLGRFINQGT
jgi:amino acid transporter